MTPPAIPIRLQLSRTKGFNLQAHSRATNGLQAVKVDRSTPYGNPFTAQAFWDAGYQGSRAVANRVCVDAYKALMHRQRHWVHGGALPAVPRLDRLRGKNLACWCRPGDSCHADVLLGLAAKLDGNA